MKKVRIALTDVNGIDLMSGNKIDQEIEIKQQKNLKERISNRIEKKKSESLVEWLWYVTL